MSRRNFFWISAVEPSADLHGSNLIKSLKKLSPDIRFIGIGGPRMRKKGLETIFSAEQISVMGITEVLSAIPRIIGMYLKIKRELKRKRPECVILLDAPDFHFRVAKIAYGLKIPVFYYISPQVWAWRKGRIKFLKKYVEKLLCIFPFEKEFFARYGMDVEYVGHPLLEEIDLDSLDTIKPVNKRVLLLPGSRPKEVKVLLPEFYKASILLKRIIPEISFVLIKAPNIKRSIIDSIWGNGVDIFVVESDKEDRYKYMRSCEVAISASGTATLECGLLGLPCVVTYKVSSISYLLAKYLVDVNFISMSNIILGKKVFPELIQEEANGENIAKFISLWLKNPKILIDIKKELMRLRSIIGNKQASLNCARIILESLK